ncbi:MAG: hypothetical protein GWN01_14380 [Nitrosopumilaceae archaeon]|nr:hypothetical protein [Nitrosopumilaceae archaeon]NIU88453.1 hypothetical protein [Nitrosopumilaceae archaeon]NIV66700.1 hypothetical protein [Nitrosopumilaceae archaeon]NIX62645.1 hypothetical protein [Nitrosopumilaceae archaeon]
MIESVGNAGSNNEFVQSNEFVTTVGIIIAGMVAGIVLWLRSSHLKQTIQK